MRLSVTALLVPIALCLPLTVSAQPTVATGPTPSPAPSYALLRQPVQAPFAAPVADNATTPAQPGPVARPAALRTRTDGLVKAPAPREDTNRGNKALMLVGLAAMVTGAVVGDDEGTILLLSGAGLGLFGLYRMMN